MAVIDADHLCGPYCGEGRHCIVVYSRRDCPEPSGISRADIAELAGYGWRPITIRRAYELPNDASGMVIRRWDGTPIEGVDSDLWRYPYLLFIEPHPGRGA
jgi:hypothetical protein